MNVIPGTIFEFALTYNGGQGNALKWSAGINGGFAQNEVIFVDEVPGAPDYQRQEGNPIGSYLVYEADGAFIDQRCDSAVGNPAELVQRGSSGKSGRLLGAEFLVQLSFEVTALTHR